MIFSIKASLVVKSPLKDFDNLLISFVVVLSSLSLDPHRLPSSMTPEGPFRNSYSRVLSVPAVEVSSMECLYYNPIPPTRPVFAALTGGFQL